MPRRADRVDLQPADLVAVALVVVAAVGVDPSGAAQRLAALAARGGGQAQSADVVRLPHQARRRWRITAWPQDHPAQYEAGYHLQVSELSREIPPEGPNSAKTPWRYWALPGAIGAFAGIIGVFPWRYWGLPRRNPGLPLRANSGKNRGSRAD